ncbi:MAG TPA: hypothetical protein PKD25_08205 [Rubrivivax sp.]|nr:hypothetical protein [Rubrivivax sp.]
MTGQPEPERVVDTDALLFVAPGSSTPRRTRQALETVMAIVVGLAAGAVDSALLRLPEPFGSLLVWLGAGMALALALRWGLPGAIGTLAGWLVGGLALGTPVLQAGGHTLALGMAVVAGTAVLRRSGGNADLERARDVGLMVLACVFVAAPLAVLGAAAAMMVHPANLPELLIPAIVVAWPWQALALLTAAVPVLAFTRPSRRASVAAARAVPGALLAFGVIGGTALWFFGPPIGLAGGTTLAWWPHVLLLVLLARGGFTLPAATAAGVSTLATAATAVGAGPFGALPPIEAER